MGKIIMDENNYSDDFRNFLRGFDSIVKEIAQRLNKYAVEHNLNLEERELAEHCLGSSINADLLMQFMIERYK